MRVIGAAIGEQCTSAAGQARGGEEREVQGRAGEGREVQGREDQGARRPARDSGMLGEARTDRMLTEAGVFIVVTMSAARLRHKETAGQI